MHMETKPKIAFFGTPDIAVWVLQELAENFVPDLIVTNPDRPQGRGLQLSAAPVKIWAKENNIPVFQPETLLDKDGLEPITSQHWDLFIVVAYGLIMPKWFIEIPKHGTINLHPSLLPKLRGASPIRTSILEGLKDAGVTIMLMDEKMDHGPILEQEPALFSFPLPGRILDKKLAQQGGELLAKVIPLWLQGKITPQEQDHSKATYAKKITKEMGELKIDPFALPVGEEAYDIYLKICAFDGWPGTFFFHDSKRIKITEAVLTAGKLEILKVIPEGRKEMLFSDFIKKS